MVRGPSIFESKCLKIIQILVQKLFGILVQKLFGILVQKLFGILVQKLFGIVELVLKLLGIMMVQNFGIVVATEIIWCYGIYRNYYELWYRNFEICSYCLVLKLIRIKRFQCMFSYRLALSSILCYVKRAFWCFVLPSSFVFETP